MELESLIVIGFAFAHLLAFADSALHDWRVRWIAIVARSDAALVALYFALQTVEGLNIYLDPQAIGFVIAEIALLALTFTAASRFFTWIAFAIHAPLVGFLVWFAFFFKMDRLF
jgi:hypothetical protein